jgi:hypothetical protein
MFDPRTPMGMQPPTHTSVNRLDKTIARFIMGQIPRRGPSGAGPRHSALNVRVALDYREALPPTRRPASVPAAIDATVSDAQPP